MALDISVDVPTSKDAGGAIDTGVRKWLEDGASVGFAQSQELVPQDRGTLLQSGFPPEWTTDGAIRWGYRANHAMPIEEGTAPFYPPLEPLLEWSKRVSGDTGLGYYVARVKIPEEGIDAQPYAEPGAEKQSRWYDANDIGRFIEDQL
jgi:hypothetical protein